MRERDSKYHVGDKVFICGVNKCRFGLNYHMRELVGEIRTIRRVLWDEGYSCHGYFIENDNCGCWTWDDSCFEPVSVAELPEFDVSNVNVLDLFS